MIVPSPLLPFANMIRITGAVALAILALGFLSSCCEPGARASSVAPTKDAPRQTVGHVILISCDGVRPDAVTFLGKEKAPTFHRLIAEGSHTKNARTDADMTVTLPNHTSMITGRGVKGLNGHNWTSNGTPKLREQLHRNKKKYLESIFDVAHDHGLRTGLYASKVKFLLYDRSYSERWARADTTGKDNGKDKIDRYLHLDNTEKLIDEYLKAVRESPYQLSMIHLRDTDSAGHAHGWDIKDGSPYLEALIKLDGLIGKILDEVESHPDLKGDTCLIVTTDHGGRLETKTHTDSTHKLNYTIPFYVWGPGVQAGGELYEMNPGKRKPPEEGINPKYNKVALPPIRNGDAGNLALSMLGLPAIKGSTINARQDLSVFGAARIPPAGDKVVTRSER